MTPTKPSPDPVEILIQNTPEIKRLDQYLVSRFPALSRASVQKVINAQGVEVNGKPARASQRVRNGDRVRIHMPEMSQPTPEAQNLPLEIVYEGRTHNAEVSDQPGMDAAFADVFSDYNLQERMEILGYGSRYAYLEAEPTIEAKAKDMVAH